MSGVQLLSWKDGHFCGLRSQTNVYSLIKHHSDDDKVRLLAASIDGQLASVEFEYQSSCQKLVPITKNSDLFNPAQNNPDSEGEMELISLDVVCDWDHEGGNAMAVTYLKLGHYDEDKAPQAFMNIFLLDGGTEGKNHFDASKCFLQCMSLEFIPFKLTHHHIPVEGSWESYLLLSGNDHKIHSFQPVGNYKGFQEVETSKHFPEFLNVDDNITQMEMKQMNDLYRLSSFGTQNGLVRLFLVNVERKEIMNWWTTEMDSPITSLHFFYQHTDIQYPDFLTTQVASESKGDDEEWKGTSALNLLVTSAVDPSAVYLDVIASGLAKCRVLPVSNSQDVVLCSWVMDVDFDGENEILIGTYGQVLLVYKLSNEKPKVFTSTPFHSPMPVPIHTDTPILSDKPPARIEGDNQDKDVRRRHKTVAAVGSDYENSSLLEKNDKHRSEEYGHHDVNSHHALMSRLFRSQENLALASPSSRSIHFETPERLLTPDLTIPQFAMAPVTEYPCYKLVWTRRFCNPVMGLSSGDLTGDGIQDLAILTLKGLHILQPDLPQVSTIVLDRLRQICQRTDAPPGRTELEETSHHPNG